MLGYSNNSFNGNFCIGLTLCLFCLLYFMISLDSNQFQLLSVSEDFREESPCFALLRQFNFTVRVILIDVNVLECVLNRTYRTANRTVNIAVDERDFEHFSLLHPVITLVPMVDNSTKDYLQFNDNGIVRIVPRFQVNIIGSMFYPANIRRFLEFWKRSQKVECKNIEMSRNTSEVTQNIPLSSVDHMANVRDLLIEFGSFPFLSGGTLLGWYRECSIIPHTHDIDFSILMTHYIQSLINFLKTQDKIFLRRILGMPSDGFELTLKVDEISIDLFFLYHDGNTSWVGGLDDNLTKYKYTYPKIENFCSVDLLDRHFFIPCNVEEILITEYGPNWMKDHPSHKFSWSSSHFNVKPNGKWPEEMRSQVYQIFPEIS